jgi:uncharacterized protein (TIGR03067 family)
MRDDLDLLQGTWSVTSLEVEGQKMTAGMLDGAQIVIKGNRFTSMGMGAVYKGTLKIDASVKPARLDMKFSAGPEKGNTNLGIYKLDEDTWKLCLAMRGDVRPSKFGSTPGSGFALETLTRAYAKKPKAAAKKKTAIPVEASAGAIATELEGEWQMVSAVMNGTPMEQSAVAWVKRVTVGNATAVYAGPQTMLKAQFMNDPSKSPKTLDYVHTAGSNKGKTTLGIYKVDARLLRICMAAPGSPRPTKFESFRGDGASCTVWKRA